MNIIKNDVHTASLAGQFLSHWWAQDFADMALETAINFLREQAQSMQAGDPHSTATNAMSLLTAWGLVEHVRFTGDFESLYISYTPNKEAFDAMEEV